MADETPTAPDEATEPADEAVTTPATIGAGDPALLEDAVEALAEDDDEGGYIVLVDGLTYYDGTEYRDRRGVNRRHARRARFGNIVDLDDDQAERLLRSGAVGTGQDAEAVRFLNAIRDRKPRERAEVLRRVGEGASLSEATLDVFGIDDVDEAADDAEAENANPDLEAETATRERLEELKADEVRAEAAAMGHDVNTRTTKADAIDLIVGGPPAGK